MKDLHIQVLNREELEDRFTRCNTKVEEGHASHKLTEETSLMQRVLKQYPNEKVFYYCYDNETRENFFVNINLSKL